MQLVNDLRGGQFDGAVVLSIHPHDTLPRMLAEADAAAVLFGRPADPMPITYVDVATRVGVGLAADRLVARGCRRVSMVSGPTDTPAGTDRLTGFREAMARHGHAYIPAVDGGFTQAGGEAAMERLLREHPDLDGVFVASDLMALGALLVLRDHGRQVPQDVAVIGFDDSSAATASRPPLTTVRQPVEEMAAELARLVLAQIEAPERRSTSVIFDPSLVVRESA